MASSYQDRINARRGTGVNKKKEKKVKTVSKDPRPKQSDIGKKYKNYGEFRQAVKAWRVRNGFAKAPKPKEKKKYVSPKERKFGKDKLKINKEIDKNVDTYVKKMKSYNPNPIRKVDYPSKTVEKPKNVSNEENKKVNKDNKEKVETPKTETPKVEVPKTETPKVEKKKTNREKFNAKFIKTKGGRLAKRGTVAARRAENREAARKRAQAAAKERLKIKQKKKKKK